MSIDTSYKIITDDLSNKKIFFIAQPDIVSNENNLCQNKKFLLIPYKIKNDNTCVISITISEKNILCLGISQVPETSQVDIYSFCSNFNQANISPKLYITKDEAYTVLCCESFYDLDIFPNNYIEKWLSSTIELTLITIKKFYELK